jgi:hypothetical protein
MRESELGRALGALVPHNLSGVRWKRRHTERATGLDFVTCAWFTCSSTPGLAAKALETESWLPLCWVTAS